MIERSGSVPLTNGFWSRKPINIWIRRIRFRNTGKYRLQYIWEVRYKRSNPDTAFAGTNIPKAELLPGGGGGGWRAGRPAGDDRRQWPAPPGGPARPRWQQDPGRECPGPRWRSARSPPGCTESCRQGRSDSWTRPQSRYKGRKEEN